MSKLDGVKDMLERALAESTAEGQWRYVRIAHSLLGDKLGFRCAACGEWKEQKSACPRCEQEA